MTMSTGRNRTLNSRPSPRCRGRAGRRRSKVMCASIQSGTAIMASQTRIDQPTTPAIHMTQGIIGSTKAMIRPGHQERQQPDEDRGGEELMRTLAGEGGGGRGPVHGQGIRTWSWPAVPCRSRGDAGEAERRQWR